MALTVSYRNLPASLDQANISNGTPSYNAAYLSELKASTPSSRRPPNNDPYDADMSMDVGDISMQSIDTVDVLGMLCTFLPSYITDTRCVAADNDSTIPSESSILNAKQKRERIRTTAASSGEDYISLSVIKQSDESKGPHPDSRLMREEDELGEGDDGIHFRTSYLITSSTNLISEFAEYTSAQERIPLGKKSKKVAANKRKETMQEMIDDACVV
jgi:GC-rich sequence DNA-binding factor